MARSIIVHPDMGVFLGCVLGLAFFSKLGDAGGQYKAPVFDSEEDAETFVKQFFRGEGWDASTFAAFSLPSGYGYDFDSIDPLLMQRAGVPAEMLTTVIQNEMLAVRDFEKLNHLKRH